METLSPVKDEVGQDDSDPGIIIVWASEAEVHACLQLLPTVPPINIGFVVAPALAAGKGYIFIAYMKLLANLHPGSNAAVSFQNLSTWLDTVMMQICPSSIVNDAAGNREHGWFQQMKLSQFLKAATIFSASMMDWGRACSVAGHSCGKLYYIGGSGLGSMTMAHQVAGPFRS